MKRFLFVFVIFISLFYFSSCVDIVQSISYKNGTYNYYMKVAFSKPVLAMSDVSPKEIYDMIEEIKKENKAKVLTIDTDIEFGVQTERKISSKTKDEEEKKRLPQINDKTIIIPFLSDELAKKSLYSDDNPFNNRLLYELYGSIKYRVLIEKSIIDDFEIAYFKGNGGQNYSIPVYDYGSVICLEIPITVLLSKDCDYRNIIFIK